MSTVSFVSQVQTLLQQMQDKFQTMSDQIIGRNILIFTLKMPGHLFIVHLKLNYVLKHSISLVMNSCPLNISGEMLLSSLYSSNYRWWVLFYYYFKENIPVRELFKLGSEGRQFFSVSSTQDHLRSSGEVDSIFCLTPSLRVGILILKVYCCLISHLFLIKVQTNWSAYYLAILSAKLWLLVLCSWAISLLDEMSTRIDDLEKNIADLMTQAGVEEIEGTPEKAKEGQGS